MTITAVWIGIGLVAFLGAFLLVSGVIQGLRTLCRDSMNERKIVPWISHIALLGVGMAIFLDPHTEFQWEGILGPGEWVHVGPWTIVGGAVQFEPKSMGNETQRWGGGESVVFPMHVLDSQSLENHIASLQKDWSEVNLALDEQSVFEVFRQQLPLEKESITSMKSTRTFSGYTVNEWIGPEKIFFPESGSWRTQSAFLSSLFWGDLSVTLGQPLDDLGGRWWIEVQYRRSLLLLWCSLGVWTLMTLRWAMLALEETNKKE